uniref:Uncharacterized protein n=1 Tax=Anguilla anguilla TaxID=7936 RepID=A0A0E9QM40_ANGAN
MNTPTGRSPGTGLGCADQQ